MENKTPDEKTYFFDKPENVNRFLRVLYVTCAILFVADFFIHRHVSMPLEEVPTFYASYGFIACVVLVLVAKGLRKLVMRREDYYETDVVDADARDAGSRNVD
jgi:hypothetical protein